MSRNLLLSVVAAALLLQGAQKAGAQGMAVNGVGATANSSAIMDVSSTSQGVLVPRMTAAQRTAVASPATGLLVYQTDGTAGFYFYNSSAWVSLSTGTGTVTSVSTTDSDPLLTSTVSNATTTPVITFSTTPAAAHKFLGNFTGSTGAASYSSPALNSADFANQGTTTTVLHGNASGNPSFGQITNTDIAAGAGIAYSKLSVTGSIQPTVDLNSSGVNSATTFLRGDNSWQAPIALTTTGSGAATFSGGTLNIPVGGGAGTVIHMTTGNLAPIFLCTVNTNTTTPAIAYTWASAAAQTVFTNSVNGVGAPQYGKVVPNALVATAGVPSATTYYRGDNTWATPTVTLPPQTLNSYGSGPSTVGAGVTAPIATSSTATTLNLPTAASYGAGKVLYIGGASGAMALTAVNAAAGDQFTMANQGPFTSWTGASLGGIIVCDGVHSWNVILMY